MKRVVFRVDSSDLIGSGHVMRCLSLANQLRHVAECFFISRDLPHHINQNVINQGFHYIQLPRTEGDASFVGYEQWLTVTQEEDAAQVRPILRDLGADILIVDHYALDVLWESSVRSYVKMIMVIDDLANRKHDCDILLDQNFHRNLVARYEGLIPKKCKKLLGPQYILLREEFYRAHERMRIRDGVIRNILVFFGGSDLTNETVKTLKAIVALDRPNIVVNVVVGGSNPHRNEIQMLCQIYRQMYYHCQVNYMAQLMTEADLAIGAGGTTTWERCFLGLPALVTAVADNQVEISEDCANAGYIEYLGRYTEVDQNKICESIQRMTPERMNEFQKVCRIEVMEIGWFQNLFASSEYTRL